MLGFKIENEILYNRISHIVPVKLALNDPAFV